MNTSLAKIELCGNNIGDEGVKAIIETWPLPQQWQWTMQVRRRLRMPRELP